MSAGFEIAAGAAAFGDGSHPTTRGVLEVIAGIDSMLFMPRVALDMGAGSGILSFALVEKFGCAVVAVDVERSAVTTLRDNVARNGLAEKITALQADGFRHAQLEGRQFNLIVMNILAEPLLRLAVEAERHLAAEGVLILSGILQWQETQIRAAYEALGLELASRAVIGDWVSLVWQKP